MDGCVFSYNGCRIKRTVSPKEQEKLPGETRVTPLVDAEAVLGSMYLAFADILNELFLLLGFQMFYCIGIGTLFLCIPISNTVPYYQAVLLDNG